LISCFHHHLILFRVIRLWKTRMWWAQAATKVKAHAHPFFIESTGGIDS